MKRSEMIDRITAMLGYKLGCSEFLAFSAANYLLDEIEESGMLPPLNENWMSLDEAKEFYGKSFDSNDISSYPRKNIHYWDSEDTI